MGKDKLLVSKIRNGTVIDHITGGLGLKVIKLLGIGENDKVVISTNVSSSKMGKKDIIKIENKHLTPIETDIISLICPGVTINKITEFEVVEKHKVKAPREVKKVLPCANPKCVTNTEEPVTTLFHVTKEGGLRCHYCERTFLPKELIK